MGIPVLILGESGSGKSTSLRNFAPDAYTLLNVAGKPLPFRGKPKYAIKKPSYMTITKALAELPTKVAVIDDSQYLLAFDFFARAKETGYGKFTDLAINFKNLIDTVIDYTPDDVVVYFLHHIEQAPDGHYKAKTIGKMLDEKLTVEGLFSIVLMCKVRDGKHYFETQSDGTNPAKSPMGMLEQEMDNDLQAVDQAIREYWEL